MKRPVIDIVTAPFEYQRIKHDLGVKYTEDELNRLSRIDFLQLISDAIEERLEQEKQK